MQVGSDLFLFIIGFDGVTYRTFLEGLLAFRPGKYVMTSSFSLYFFWVFFSIRHLLTLF